MVLEDALTIVSYASPYPVRLLIRKAPCDTINNGGSTHGSVDSMGLANSTSGLQGIDNSGHQFSANYRSQSLNDLSMIVKDSILPCNEVGEMFFLYILQIYLSNIFNNPYI